MTDKILDHLLAQNTMLLDRALTGDGAQLTQLQADLDAAHRQNEKHVTKIRDLEQTVSILTGALDESSEHAETAAQELEKTNEAHRELRNLLRDRDETIQHLSKQVEDLETRPAVHPEWEDVNRFIDAAIQSFDEPERSFRELTRAHLALQGKENTND